ncbi:MAG: acyl-ACP desaturase [Acidobacteriota bacterium]
MVFETKKEVLDWYERQPRALTPQFLSEIPWDSVKDHPLNPKLVPVLLYMRDVELLTDMYHRQMLRTPTGRDPVIKKFMERWGVEEIAHGEVLDRFLNEAGYSSGEGWQDSVRGNISRFYRAHTYFITTLTNLIGHKFTATHMTFGTIHELSTAQAYRRLAEIADHPVLTHILNGILREESAHMQFYRSVARIELRNNQFAQRLARFVVEHFWAPVGQGSVAQVRTDYLIATLFGDSGGQECVDNTLSQRVRGLPGFADLTKISETIRSIAARSFDQSEIALMMP